MARFLARMASGLELLQLAPSPFLLCAPHLGNLLKMGFPGCDVRGKPAAPACASSSLINGLSLALLSLEEREGGGGNGGPGGSGPWFCICGV